MAEDTIYGGPNKRFFVSMLTRDIELGDAILDLVDNCVDGAMRKSKTHLDPSQPFKGYWAELTVSKDAFEIKDNCGGIPASSIENAFVLGRPKIAIDRNVPTIGVYGIGMKRAIFKIGNAASVQSNSADGFFSVDYTSDWLNPDNDEWELPINRQPKKVQTEGVVITVSDVKADIGSRFANEAFLNTLKNNISEHFGYLMQKGFVVRVNNEELRPRVLSLFNADHSDVGDIRAFDFEAKVDDVSIKVTIGFFRGLVREYELDQETESAHDVDLAGISVVCNDRVILLNDTSMKTGWGDGGVPRYHPQFRAIAGLMIFSSNDAEKLPISTTKRDLDVGADLFLTARRVAMEGLKVFTDFTNKWKGIEEETTQFFDARKKVDVKTGIASAASFGSTLRGSPDAKKYVPNLPLPVNKDPRRRISFMRPESDIHAVSRIVFGESGQHPSLVGAECFDRVLAEGGRS